MRYARHRLLQTDNADQLRRSHFEFIFNRFRDSFLVLRRERQLPRLRRLREEQENVRAALEWAIASPDLAEEAVEFAGALFWFWTKCGLFEEGRLWLSRALGLQSSRDLRARALMGLAHMHYFQGRLDETATCTAEALSLSREAQNPWIESFALFFQSLVAFEHGDHEEAIARALRRGPLRPMSCSMVGPCSSSRTSHCHVVITIARNSSMTNLSTRIVMPAKCGS